MRTDLIGLKTKPFPKTAALGPWYRNAIRSGVLGGIFCMPISLNAAVVFLVSAGLLLVAEMVWTGEVYMRRTPMDLWVAGFALLAAVSVWTSAYAAEGLYNYIHLMGLYILVYLLITQTVRTKREGRLIVIALLASSAVVCIWGLLQYHAGMDVTAERWVDGDQFPELKKRVFSTLGNPNVLAAFLVMVVGLASGWSLDTHERKRKGALIFVSALAVLCILLTYSRGAWLSLGAMALMMAAVWRHWNWRVILAVAAVLVILLAAMHEAFLARLLSIREMFNSADSSVALRWALWESTLAMIGEHPWIGLGWGSYRFVYPEYDFFVQNESVIIYHGHNTLLSLAAEIGIPGALCLALAWGMSVVRSLKAMKHSLRSSKGFNLGIALAMSGMAAFSLTDHVLFNIQVTAIFWTLLALTVSLPAIGPYARNRTWFYKKFRGVAGVFRSRSNN